jgi:hypothetical protein
MDQPDVGWWQRQRAKEPASPVWTLESKRRGLLSLCIDDLLPVSLSVHSSVHLHETHACSPKVSADCESLRLYLHSSPIYFQYWYLSIDDSLNDE